MALALLLQSLKHDYHTWIAKGLPNMTPLGPGLEPAEEAMVRLVQYISDSVSKKIQDYT